LGAPQVITFAEQIGRLSVGLTLVPDPRDWNSVWNEGDAVVMAAYAASAGGRTCPATVTASDAAGTVMLPAVTRALRP
jgi:hypothetical protein